jgi:2-desacetyl-2-hydroxyethyl bacteriochlorophyllide A dehydrogenase
MKAIRMVAPGKALELHEAPLPEVGWGDVLVKVMAAGICHSDVHYRAGRSRVDPLPLTLGHETAGVVEAVGPGVASIYSGDRVCVHYMVTCGACYYCTRGSEQFCPAGKMVGKYRDGGFAEYLGVPARSVVKLPEGIPFDHGAILMCSSATAFHALRKARLQPGEKVAVFGAGGLGMSAIQLAFAFGASQVFAVDINPRKLALAEALGAVGVHAAQVDPVKTIFQKTGGHGVDVALELIGLPLVMEQAFRSLGVLGRVAIAGITEKTMRISPYMDLINKEAEVIGVSDHLAQEIPLLLEWTSAKKLDLSRLVTQVVPLEAEAVNRALDNLEIFGDQVRVVIHPWD